MIDTDLKQFESDLREILNLFDGAEELNIRHKFTKGENKVVNTITINGKVYAYGNLMVVSDKIIEKRLTKRYAKLSLYKSLSKYFNKELPWGALTGIRPTKLAYSQMELGENFEEFFNNNVLKKVQ